VGVNIPLTPSTFVFFVFCVPRRAGVAATLFPSGRDGNWDGKMLLVENVWRTWDRVDRSRRTPHPRLPESVFRSSTSVPAVFSCVVDFPKTGSFGRQIGERRVGNCCLKWWNGVGSFLLVGFGTLVPPPTAFRRYVPINQCVCGCLCLLFVCVLPGWSIKSYFCEREGIRLRSTFAYRSEKNGDALLPRYTGNRRASENKQNCTPACAHTQEEETTALGQHSWPWVTRVMRAWPCETTRCLCASPSFVL